MEWHRSEPRDVRPFFAAQKAESALENTGIRLTAESDICQEASFELDDADLLKLEPVIYPTIANIHSWIPQGLSASDLDLLVLARQALLKRSELVGRYPLSEPIPDEIEIPGDVIELLGGGRNAQMTVAIVLAADRDPEPGSPFVRGHWLARKTFSLRTRSTPALFDIRPRGDEEWVANGYPAKTLYAVEYLSGIEATDEDGAASIAVVHIHSDAHIRLVDTKLGDSVQPLLAAEIITSILQQSLSDWEGLETAPSGSALETLVKQLTKVQAVSLHELAALAKSGSPRLRAIVQSRLGVVQTLR